MTFIIAERRKELVTESRPTNYLLEVLPNNRRSYFSSMYPTSNPNLFRIEYGGKWWVLQLNEYEASIYDYKEERPREEFSSYDYKLELVPLSGTATNTWNIKKEDVCRSRRSELTE